MLENRSKTTLFYSAGKVKQEKNTKAWLVAVNTMVMACGSQGTTQNPKNPGMEPTPTESGHYRNLVNVIPDIREGCET